MTGRSLILASRTAAIAAAVLAFSFPTGAAAPALPTASRIKGTSFSAVYYLAINGKRYVFPNEKTYKTWYKDFSGIQTISDETLASLPIGGNVTYRPGVKMLKVTTAPKVYAVAKGGTLRWVTQGSIAQSYYGADWAKQIDDLPDAFFVNYKEGATIRQESDFLPAIETTSTNSIDADKDLKALIVKQPPPPPPLPSSKIVDVDYTINGFVPMKIFVNVGDTVRWTDHSTHDLLVRPNPHPDHTEYPGFAVDIPSDQQGQWTFTEAKTFGFHSHLNSGAWGTITVSSTPQ